MRTRAPLLLLVPAAALAALVLPALRAAPADQPREDFTAEVVQGDLPIQVELSGSFVAEDKDEIAMEPKSYRGDLIITELLPEGSEVEAGDVLIAFDAKTIERSLEDARNEVADKQVALEKAKAEAAAFEIERATKLSKLTRELGMAGRAVSASQERAKLELADKEKTVTDAEQRLADARVDLEQLMQLYEERELHTATENILVARERRGVENLERGLAKTREELRIWKEFEQNDEVEKKEIERDDKQSELDRAKLELGAQQAEKDAAREKAQRELEKAERDVEELVADAASLSVVSPRDGIVFYGTIGSEGPSDMVIVGFGMNEEMRLGGRVRTHQVLLTVASMENLSVRMNVQENDIQHMQPGLPTTIVPDAFPSLRLKGELTQVDQVASRRGILSELRDFTVRGKYEGVYRQLRSGMNCRVTVHADTVPDAVQVPVVAVFQEGGEHYCLVRDGKRDVRRAVKLGASNGSVVQVTEGLRKGEVVTLHDPTED